MLASRRTAVPLLLSLVLLAIAGSCGSSEPVDELAGRKREILSALGNNVIMPTLRDFATRAAALETATAADAASPTDDNREAARAAFRDATAVWQRAEMMQIGPAGMGGTLGVQGGQNLRDEIYSWPVEDSCRVDEETLSEVYADPERLAAELVNVRGLDALEYLLFVAEPTHSCSTLDGWDALSVEEIRQRRADYAHNAAILVARVANTLRDAWEPTGGDHIGQLSTAGDTSTLYRTAQSALDDLAGAMLYIDASTRDMKLAEPAGISERCPTETCPDALEAGWSQTSRENLIENLRGFQLLFLGGEPGTDALGIDDLLVDVGAGELATSLATAIADAISALENVPSPLLDNLTDPAVLAAYDAIDPAQRTFKVDVVTVLDLTPSAVGPGDND